jgi:manganese efflux pump family protein
MPETQGRAEVYGNPCYCDRMSAGAMLLLAVGVAFDATAVAAARGCALKRILPKHVLLVALFFGGFQALMPLAGYLLGSGVGPLVQAFDHWIAFLVLAAVGGKMVWEARKGADEAEATSDERLFALPVMLTLALATSIDALAVGFTLPLLGAPLVTSILMIGLVTAAMSAAGLFVGHRFGAALGRRLDLAGGAVLILLGVKIVLEHTLNFNAGF